MTPYQQAVAQLNQKYSGATTTSAPPKPTLLQKAGNFVKNTALAVAKPFVRAGVEGYNLTEGIDKTIHGDYAGANAALNQSRNLPLYGQTKPTVTLNEKGNVGPSQALDIVGQGIQLGSLAGGGELNYGKGIIAGAKTGGTIGATQGFGNALTETQGKSVGQNLGNIAGQTATGGVTGAVLGGGTAAVHQIFTRPTPIMNPEDVSSNLKVAQQAREQVGQNAVQNQTKMNQQVGQFKTSLGTNFEQGAQKMEIKNPDLKLSLTNKQLESLNNLKESKLFSLPSTLDTESNPLMGSNMSPAVLAKNADKISALQNATKAELTPTETQDLIRRLNKLTFASKASGDLSVNQQTIDLTNEVKQAANQAFKGTKWEDIYSDYAKGINAIEKLDGIVNLDKNTTPADLNKSLNSILKLGETPEGKAILKNAVQEYKDVSGIDLSDPIQAMHQILDKQLALEEAQSGFKSATKEAATEAAKGGFGKRFLKGASSPEYLGKRLIEGVAIGAGSSILIYPALKKLSKLITGQP